ncbi:Na+/H+ antiporter subunit E [Streptomyces chumphonensis]|uniref:Na+/H+ antiporter subunit E n=1 Tax=Streptomyces chumphonensis TaxID=1214925 RepID=A0A927F2N8_9ACTN|nr:Na+/H+ antiporter subunit E [Streptomyces chumphonensis]MBD3933262.1 Na+/H+ antiporter subunit E [Streptomyces chumphonensis]
MSGGGPASGRRRALHPLRQTAGVLWLWALWVLLWGTPSAVVVVGGLLVSLAVTFAFRLPPVAHRAALRPVLLAVLVLRLLADLVVSAVDVAVAAVRLGPRARAAVVEVPLAADSDLMVTGTAVLTTMTPGNLVLEIDRDRRLLYVHLLPVSGPAAARRRRQDLRATEREVVHALGPADAPHPEDGDRPEDPARPDNGKETP